MNGGPYTARRYGGSSRAVDDDESVRAARTTIQSGRTRGSAGRTRITPRSGRQTASPDATVADMGAMPLDEQIIGVVDDDESVRMAVGSLLRSLGFKIEMFGSAEDLLGSAQLDDIACLIVDVQLPGLSGLDLQRQLLAGKREFPMIFISAHDDPVARRQALTAGALAFIRKPFSEKALIDAVRAGLSQGGHRSNP
jgi:CheY-like chemotaxis protein